MATKDIYYENQILACKRNKYPLFASRQCFHDVPWSGNYHDKPTQFGEMLVHKYGEEEAWKQSNTPQIDCPICHKSWCD